MLAGRVDRPNQFKLGHVSFLTGQNIENIYFEELVSLKYVCDLHFHRQWARTFYSTWILKCRAASDNNNQNSLYYFIRNAHLTLVTLHTVLYYFTTYVGCDFGCKHFQFLKTTKALSTRIQIFSKKEIFSVFEKNLKNPLPILQLQAAEIYFFNCLYFQEIK